MPIYVVGHKPAPMPDSDLYQHVSVGNQRNFSPQWRDDVGDNIAHLNKYYCELTAYYWIWKNLKSDDFIGLCHYRRYFNVLPNNRFQEGWVNLSYTDESSKILAQPDQRRRVVELLDMYDIIIPRNFPTPFTLRESYMETQNPEEWDIFVEEVDHLFGSKQNPLRTLDKNTYGNMLICKQELFNLYCHQLFFVINRVFEKIGVYEEVPGKRYQNFRYPGYLAERFLSAFIFAHRLRAFEAQILSFDNI